MCALLTAARAQITYQEQGDAGDLPETAQATGTDTNTALSAIRGTLEENGVDMYVIYIQDPANFSANTVNNETTFDTQLWLFDAEGKGVVFNDDAVGTSLNRSTINNSTGCLTDRAAGIYYTAITRDNRDAIGCEDKLIWANYPFRAVRCPDGPERGSRVAGWTGTTAIAGNYEITLTGAFTALRSRIFRPARRLTAGTRRTTAAATRATCLQRRKSSKTRAPRLARPLCSACADRWMPMMWICLLSASRIPRRSPPAR